MHASESSTDPATASGLFAAIGKGGVVRGFGLIERSVSGACAMGLIAERNDGLIKGVQQLVGLRGWRHCYGRTRGRQARHYRVFEHQRARVR
jgi:hypothetical protein